MQWEASSKTASNQDKSKLYSFMKTEHGFKGHCKITESTQIHFLYN